MSLWEKKLKLKHLAIFGAVIIIGSFASYALVELTSTTPFCGTACHEMTPMYVSWEHSNHKTVDCADCHEQPGIDGLVKSKAKGMYELFLHVTGNVPENIKVHDLNEVNCYHCHQDKVKTASIAAPRKDPHTEKHFELGMNCMTCHTGLVHTEGANRKLPTRESCYTCHLDAMGSL